jgi:hypothetical protein
MVQIKQTARSSATHIFLLPIKCVFTDITDILTGSHASESKMLLNEHQIQQKAVAATNTTPQNAAQHGVKQAESIIKLNSVLYFYVLSEQLHEPITDTEQAN